MTPPRPWSTAHLNAEWRRWTTFPPDFVPAALAFGSRIHGAVGYFYRQAKKGQAPGLEDLTAYFEAY
ncbi:MAG: hypothetical protein HY726_07675 [Candidatus Rokubacteria bacterium]|nr:hypothetical protein [Candidatus Rokubacteria bacterium]